MSRCDAGRRVKVKKKRKKASRINEGKKAREVNFDLLLCISVQLSCNGNVMLREQRQKSTLSHWNLCSPLLMVWNLQYVWPAVQHYSCFSSLYVDETIPGCGSFLGPILQCSFLFCEWVFMPELHAIPFQPQVYCVDNRVAWQKWKRAKQVVGILL